MFIFRLQPHTETQEKQISAWASLVLEYYKTTKQAVLDIREIHSFPLFNNTAIKSKLLNAIVHLMFIKDRIKSLNHLNISGKLPAEVVSIVLDNLTKSGNACPLDKTKQRWLIYWHTLDEWGDIIYTWAQNNGFIGSVCTLFELTQGDNTIDEGELIQIYNLKFFYIQMLIFIFFYLL